MSNPFNYLPKGCEPLPQGSCRATSNSQIYYAATHWSVTVPQRGKLVTGNYYFVAGYDSNLQPIVTIN